jgi:hypothetical protein
MKILACLFLCAAAAFCDPTTHLVSGHTLVAIGHSSLGIVLEVAYNDAKHQLAYYDDPNCDPTVSDCGTTDPNHGPTVPPDPGDGPECPSWYCCLFGWWCVDSGSAELQPIHEWQPQLDFVLKQ